MMLDQSRIRLLRRNTKKEEVKEAGQPGRIRTSHARSELTAKKLGRFVNSQHKQTRNRTCQQVELTWSQNMIREW
jgi:hypothetical protein